MRLIGIITRHGPTALTRCALVAVFMTVLLAGAAFAQAGAESPKVSDTAQKLGTLAPQERLDLIAKLDDTQARELLLYFLDKTASPAAATPSGPEDLFRDLNRRSDLLRANLIEMLKS